MTVGMELQRKPGISANVKLVRLGDHVDILSGFAFDSSRFAAEGEMPLVRIRDVVRGRTGTHYSGPFDERFIVRKGDLLVGMDGDFNRETWSSEPALLNQRVCRISPLETHLDSRYLYHFLPQALMEIWHATPYATVKHLSVKAIREIALPLPPLDEQRRIAAILDMADQLRTKRRQALAALDTLAQSIFDSMFGDPVRNEQGWNWHPVSDFISDATGGKNIVGSADAEGGYRVLKISAVTSLRFNPAETKPLPAGYVPPDQHLLRKGDLLFSRANTTELVGATVLVREAPERVSLPDKIWRLEPDPGTPTDPRFVEALFQHKTFRAKVSALASGSSGSMKNISKPKLFSIHTGVPPFELQLAFGDRIEATARLQDSGRSQLAELDVLFASLQAHAFRGEL